MENESENKSENIVRTRNKGLVNYYGCFISEKSDSLWTTFKEEKHNYEQKENCAIKRCLM